jgi:hypothetical protein
VGITNSPPNYSGIFAVSDAMYTFVDSINNPTDMLLAQLLIQQLNLAALFG